MAQTFPSPYEPQSALLKALREALLKPDITPVPSSLSKALSPKQPLSLPKLINNIENVNIERKSQYFLDKTIYLDGYKFIGCRFDNCKLISVSGKIFLDHCIIGEGTMLDLKGNALKAVTLYNALNGNTVTEYVPEENTDGTISITKSIQQ